MEKRKPTHDLAAFRFVAGDVERLAMTVTALRSAEAVGFDRSEVAAVVRSMQRGHFYKSMTSHGDHRQWQDVYYVPWKGMTLYVKFTANAVTEFLVLSFKER